MAKSPSIKREKWIRLSLTWLIVILVSVVIIYPLVWTVGASLNAGNSLLSTSIIPEKPVIPALCRPVQRQCELPHLVLEFDENQLHDHGADLNQRQFYRLRLFPLSF